jgi:hypothetical protein
MRSSYGHHYRRMLMPVLDTLRFQSNNTRYRPVVEALAVLKANRDTHHGTTRRPMSRSRG